MKVFVLHYTKLTDRKSFILSQFEKQKITNYEFIELFDKSEISKIYDQHFQKISLGSTSLILKHQFAYNKISSIDDTCLILEDDAILCESFMDKLKSYVEQLPNDFDMLFIGDGCGLHIESSKILPDKLVYEKTLYPTHWGGDGATRCTDSYIVSKKCAEKLCTYISNINYKINLPIDWWLNVVARQLNLKVYWAEPTIVTQGSSNGMFNGSYSV